MIYAAIARALQSFDEYFEVGVTSVAKDGVAPELNSG